jgi:hypothetical protein
MDIQDLGPVIRPYPHRPKNRLGIIKTAAYDDPVLPSRWALSNKYYYFVNVAHSADLDTIISTWDLPIFTAHSYLGNDSEKKGMWFQGPPDDERVEVLRRYLVRTFGYPNPPQLQFILIQANPAINFGHRFLGFLNEILESYRLN